MASFNEMMKIADTGTFRRRVEYAMKKVAIGVMAEDGATANHAERVVYASTVLNGTASVAQYANAVVTNATLTTNGNVENPPTHGISDVDLEFTVTSMFNAMAGVATN